MTIVTETASILHTLIQDEDANFDNGVYEIQLCTYTATTTALINVTQTFVQAETPVDVIDTLEGIMANNTRNKAAGALAVKELNSNMGGCTFSTREDGAYVTYKVGADSVTKKLGSGKLKSAFNIGSGGWVTNGTWHYYNLNNYDSTIDWSKYEINKTMLFAFTNVGKTEDYSPNPPGPIVTPGFNMQTSFDASTGILGLYVYVPLNNPGYINYSGTLYIIEDL